MTWILLIVIVAALGYAFIAIGEHRSIVRDLQPEIERTEEEAEALGREIRVKAAEVKEGDEILTDLKNELLALRKEITSVEAAIASAKEEETRLENEKYRQEFKRKR